jgi:hypothetical protein
MPPYAVSRAAKLAGGVGEVSSSTLLFLLEMAPLKYDLCVPSLGIKHSLFTTHSLFIPSYYSFRRLKREGTLTFYQALTFYSFLPIIPSGG